MGRAARARGLPSKRAFSTGERLSETGAGRHWFRAARGGMDMKKLGIALAIAIAAASAAHAANLPTTKPAEAPPPVNCFASIWTYLDSTPADCPLSWGPFTVY